MGDTLDATYGAMFIGVLFATFFQGVLTIQAYVYYESFPGDPTGLKALVASVWILDLAHLVLVSQACYHYLITSWGNNAAFLVSTQPLDLHLVFVGMATIVCQGFFLFRIWTLSKKNWILVGILGAACVVVFALEATMSAQISIFTSVAAFASVTGELVTTFGLGAAVDLVMAMILVWYLQQGKTGFDRTSFVLSRVIQYTVSTGLATSSVAVAALVAYLARPNDFIFIAIHFSMGRLYTNALLATLNSRRNLRQVLEAPSMGRQLGPFMAAVPATNNTSASDETDDIPLNRRPGKVLSLLPN
ncbi:hypothetical protein C8R47DRAFT_1112345 [Mycena vitilis]|nr:hypothetical protein C8R47DRAFT_1112345 [Mycena vitilis]